MRGATRRRLRTERGTAMIETALTLPLVLFVCVSIFEFGRAYQHWQVLTNATREGARIAVLPTTTDSAVVARVQQYVAAGQLPWPDDATVTIAPNDQISIGATTASASTVTVNYPFEFIVLEPVAQLLVRGSAVGAPFTMTASATMRNE